MKTSVSTGLFLPELFSSRFPRSEEHQLFSYPGTVAFKKDVRGHENPTDINYHKQDNQRNMGEVSKTEVLLDFQGLPIHLFTGSLNKHLLRVSYTLGFLDGTNGKELACRRHKSCRFDPQVGKIPWRKA